MAANKMDSTLAVLREIRDAARATNERLNGLATELHDTNVRLDALHRMQTESELRLATALTEVHATVKDVAALIRETRASERIAALEQRLAAVERKVG